MRGHCIGEGWSSHKALARIGLYPNENSVTGCVGVKMSNAGHLNTA